MGQQRVKATRKECGQRAKACGPAKGQARDEEGQYEGCREQCGLADIGLQEKQAKRDAVKAEREDRPPQVPGQPLCRGFAPAHDLSA